MPKRHLVFNRLSLTSDQTILNGHLEGKNNKHDDAGLLLYNLPTGETSRQGHFYTKPTTEKLPVFAFKYPRDIYLKTPTTVIATNRIAQNIDRAMTSRRHMKAIIFRPATRNRAPFAPRLSSVLSRHTSGNEVSDKALARANIILAHES